MYVKAKMLSCIYQLVSVSQYAMKCCHLHADHKQSKLGTERDSYTVTLLILPLVLLTIAKFNGLSECCFVVALFTALYVYCFEYLVHILLQVEHLHKCYNFMEI